MVDNVQEQALNCHEVCSRDLFVNSIHLEKYENTAKYTVCFINKSTKVFSTNYLFSFIQFKIYKKFHYKFKFWLVAMFLYEERTKMTSAASLLSTYKLLIFVDKSIRPSIRNCSISTIFHVYASQVSLKTEIHFNHFESATFECIWKLHCCNFENVPKHCASFNLTLLCSHTKKNLIILFPFVKDDIMWETKSFHSRKNFPTAQKLSLYVFSLPISFVRKKIRNNYKINYCMLCNIQFNK